MISRFVLWIFVPRKLKKCVAFCLACKYFEECRSDVKSIYEQRFSASASSGSEAENDDVIDM